MKRIKRKISIALALGLIVQSTSLTMAAPHIQAEHSGTELTVDGSGEGTIARDIEQNLQLSIQEDDPSDTGRQGAERGTGEAKEQQPEERELEEQGSEREKPEEQRPEGSGAEGQALEEQQTKDQEPEDQDPKEQGSEEQRSTDQELEGQQTKGQGSEVQGPEGQEPKEQEPEGQEPEGQGSEGEEPEEQGSEEREGLEQQEQELQDPEEEELDLYVPATSSDARPTPVLPQIPEPVIVDTSLDGQAEDDRLLKEEKAAEIFFDLEKDEIQYKENVDFTIKNIPDEDSSKLVFRAEKEGTADKKTIRYSFKSEGLTDQERQGTLSTGSLEPGDWTIFAVVDDNEVADAVLTITPQKNTIRFLRTLTKQIGEKDPEYLPYGSILITDNDGDQIATSLRITKLLRKEGEESGSYEITGVETEDKTAEYVVVQDEYAKLEILKLPVTNCSAKYYIDANRDPGLTVDLLSYKNSSGELVVPQDMKSPKVICGEFDDTIKKCLAGDPVIEQNNVSIRLAVPIVKHDLQVPFVIQSDNYQDLTFVLDIHSDYLKERTKDEIKDFYKTHPFNTSARVTFSSTPTFSPYTVGRVSKESERDGLNALNFVRFIAGIYPEVSINDQMAYHAQAASLVNAKNNELSHLPAQPSDMPDDIYRDGALGARSSNIAWSSGGLSLSETIMMYMDDGDAMNIDSVGHRRWCLNPSMRYTGFGYCDRYSALYAFDGSGADETTEGYVPWPAKVMPYEYLDGPWSVQFDPGSYQVDDGINVILKTSSGKTMSFSKDHADGFFSFDNINYGMGPAVIFKPSASIGKNETVDVQITGIHRPDGTETEISYTVTFFSLSTSSQDVSSGGSSSGGSSGSSGGGSSGSGGGGSSGGGGGGGSSGGRSSSGGPGAISTLTGTWIKDSVGWWLEKSDKSYPKDQWARIDGAVYHFNADGYMTEGWLLQGGKWYYLLPGNGAMATGWALVSDKWYYLNANGAMATGWVQVSDKWYHLNADGAMETGWILVSGKWYYLGNDGAMFADTTTPDGYRVGSDGAWIQ